MENKFKNLTTFIQQIGAADIIHTGEKNYLAHVIGVYNDLKKWGCDDDLCHAGLFHSIYGTQQFQKFTLPVDRRGEIRDMIGARAERLAYWNCAMYRPTFDASVQRDEPPWWFEDRLTGDRVEMSDDEFDDLMTLHLCDWLEQAPRSKNWDHRRAPYRRMAERLGGVALESYDRLYATEKVAVG